MKQHEKIYGLIGYPLGHSFSREFFTEKFARENINAEYRNFELEDIGSIMELISEYPTLCGLNVTVPYKEQILPYIDTLSPDAKEIGAVNVIKITGAEEGNPHFYGDNTDWIGFSESLLPITGDLHTKALVLGTGGASKAVCYALRQMGLEVTRVSRTEGKADLTYGDLNEQTMKQNSLIVNTTPLGTWPDTDSAPPIPYDLLTPSHLCYDLVYNPAVTRFMQLSAEKGAAVKNGLEMLHRQALAAWKIWNS